MAVIKRGILGGFQNKIANVVGGSWKGISYMRSLPISVANPRTSAQTTQRDRFKGVVQFAGFILASVIKPLWDRFAQYQSGYNAFISTNIDAFMGTTLSSPNSLIISKGTLAPAALSSCVVDNSARTLTFGWDSTPGGDANTTDMLYVVLYIIETGSVEGIATGIQRSAGTAVIPVNGDFTTGNSYYAYAAFRKVDGTKVSNTDYFFGTVVA